MRQGGTIVSKNIADSDSVLDIEMGVLMLVAKKILFSIPKLLHIHG